MKSQDTPEVTLQNLQHDFRSFPTQASLQFPLSEYSPGTRNVGLAWGVLQIPSPRFQPSQRQALHLHWMAGDATPHMSVASTALQCWALLDTATSTHMFIHAPVHILPSPNLPALKSLSSKSSTDTPKSVLVCPHRESFQRFPSGPCPDALCLKYKSLVQNKSPRKPLT